MKCHTIHHYDYNNELKGHECTSTAFTFIIDIIAASVSRVVVKLSDVFWQMSTHTHNTIKEMNGKNVHLLDLIKKS